MFRFAKDIIFYIFYQAVYVYVKVLEITIENTMNIWYINNFILTFLK